MSTSREDLIGEYVTKAGQARASMWSAIGNVFGFIIAAASIVSALSKPVWWLLIPILVTSFGGVMALLRCFRLMHRGYIEIIESAAKHDERSDDEKLADAIKEIGRPEPINKTERWAIILLWLSSLLFFAQAIKSFF